MDERVVEASTSNVGEPISLLHFVWSPDSWNLSVEFGWPLIVIVFVLAVALLAKALQLFTNGGLNFDYAEVAFGDSKINFRPNDTDRQVAYAVWVELSTRKIGLEIDLDDDVIAEIYDSWFTYFTVTRELIKGISVKKVRSNSTRQIITLSIDVLNDGLRPHLTKWQARYRSWYENREKEFDKNDTGAAIFDPQAVQRKFPKYQELSSDLLEVNRRLIEYRKSIELLVFPIQKQKPRQKFREIIAKFRGA